ncbi:hypothetical protein [Bacillus sp. EB600]|uniref:hypothetical protein n=1 Tax=Bacillus sp. EB600 TaxID=2806345 RepID=UPI00210AE396|nr:hypothetical protein [Bacillus sp. EB600]MCQ6282890.1 hypothetical protein [Bacillus sp. EB600]
MNQEKWEQLKEKLLNAKETAKANNDLNQYRTLKWVLGEMNKLEQKEAAESSSTAVHLVFFTGFFLSCSFFVFSAVTISLKSM